MAVQQWRNLIAVGYGARQHGISRHDSAVSAVEKCPSLVLLHVDLQHDKVSLEPYRQASREIMPIFASYGPCEKASVDECYLDLTEPAKRLLTNHPRAPDLATPTVPLPTDGTRAPLWTPNVGAFDFGDFVDPAEAQQAATDLTHIYGHPGDTLASGWTPADEGEALLVAGARIAAAIRRDVQLALGEEWFRGVGWG